MITTTRNPATLRNNLEIASKMAAPPNDTNKAGRLKLPSLIVLMLKSGLKKESCQERTYNANDNIGDHTLPIVGLHEQTGNPADHTPAMIHSKKVDRFALLTDTFKFYAYFLNYQAIEE